MYNLNSINAAELHGSVGLSTNWCIGLASTIGLSASRKLVTPVNIWRHLLYVYLQSRSAQFLYRTSG